MPPQTHIYPNNPAVARAAAELFVSGLRRTTGRYTVALSGGSTPKLLFRLLGEEYRERINWSRLELFWGDERCVPHSSPESNYGVTHELLLQHVSVPPGQVHAIDCGDDPAAAADRYANLLRERLPSERGLPVFDLVFLGMGDDGHTASIFPDQRDLLTAAELAAPARHPESGQIRISLTGPIINNARRVAFLVTGAGKQERVGDVLRQRPGYEQYPAAHIDPAHGELHWLLDEAAAAELREG
jgi:6-phosphogluconolactonase